MKVTTPLAENYIGGVVHRFQLDGDGLIWIRATIVDAWVTGRTRSDRQLNIDVHTITSLTEDKTWRDMGTGRLIVSLEDYEACFVDGSDVLNIQLPSREAPDYVLLPIDAPELLSYRVAWIEDDQRTMKILRVSLGRCVEEDYTDADDESKFLEWFGVEKLEDQNAD